MKLRLIDSHSHLYSAKFEGDIEQVMERASEAGVGKIILPAIDSGSHKRLAELANRYPRVCYPTIGLHPTSVNDNPRWREELSLVEHYLEEPTRLGVDKFYAVGEIGLDLHWSQDFMEEQIEAFRVEIELALRYELPVIIHTRSAWAEMTAVLESYKGRGLRGVMHSFSGSYAHYEAVRGVGDFLFGVSGVVTYKNSEVAELLARVSIDDIVLETDAPYLPPVPFRGRRNESSYVKHTALAVAEIMGLAVDEVAEKTSRNAERLFGI